jgi:hypothetical protein
MWNGVSFLKFSDFFMACQKYGKQGIVQHIEDKIK